MTMPVASLLGIVYVVSEIGLGIKKRAKAGDSQIADQGSLGLLWLVIGVSVALSFMLASMVPEASMGGGLAAIAADHQLIETGPYRFVRHPSYTGALMAFLGMAICIGNWASVAVMMVPIFFVFLRRMQVEEAALLRAFPDRYASYMNRTKRLIPAIY